MNCDKCSNRNRRRVCKICHEGDCFEEVALSNYERITKMTIEEVAKLIGAIKCNTYMSECGYPACQSMDGNYCNAVRKNTDKDILEWLQKKV